MIAVAAAVTTAAAAAATAAAILLSGETAVTQVKSLDDFLPLLLILLPHSIGSMHFTNPQTAAVGALVHSSEHTAQLG
jgi:hypothetical protein